MCGLSWEGEPGKLLLFLKDLAVNLFGFVLCMVGESKNYFRETVSILDTVCVCVF